MFLFLQNHTFCTPGPRGCHSQFAQSQLLGEIFSSSSRESCREKRLHLHRSVCPPPPSSSMLEVLEVGTVLHLEREAWSMVKFLKQATNEYTPPPTPIRLPAYVVLIYIAGMLITKPNCCAAANGLRSRTPNRRRVVLVLRVGLLLQLHSRDQDHQADSATTGERRLSVSGDALLWHPPHFGQSTDLH